LVGGEGVGNDIILRNDKVTIVIDALESPHDLAPTGGNIVDFGPNGGSDDVVQIYQLAGLLPDDAFAYTSREVIDNHPDYVALVLRGTLDGRPDVDVVTRYEMHPCEPGVRVRSELHNGGSDVQVYILSDVSHWGKRNALPFAPLEGQGFLQPELELLDFQDVFFEFPYVAARPIDAEGATYGFVPCSRDVLEGVNDIEISALGTQRALLRPGESLVHERFLVATPGGDLGQGIEAIASARQMLHGDPDPVAVRGRIVGDSLGFGGAARRAAVVLSEDVGGADRPLTTVVPAQDGTFSALVPTTGAIRYDVWSFGRSVASGDVAAGGGDIGDVEIELPATVSLAIADQLGEPMYGMVVFHPADDATRARVTGSWFGRFLECAPWLGSPVGGSPACNRVVMTPAGTDVEVPAGNYDIYASAGPEWSVATQQVLLVAGETTDIDFTLTAIPTRPAGWLSTDLHVHGQGSFDSSLPDRDRVLSFVANGVDVVAATDHDFVADYRSAVRDEMVEDRVRVIGGLETTGLIPFMDVPGEDFPRVIGHFNHWPLTPSSALPRGGAPWDEMLEPGELFDILGPMLGPDGISMINHPWDETQFGRDLGYLRAIKFDPRRSIPAEPDGSNNGVLLERPNDGRRNNSWHVIEVQNGAHVKQVIKTRILWFSLTSQGFVYAGVGNSDSHALTDNQLGFGRSLVDAGVSLDSFTVPAFNGALRDGKVIGGNGVVVDVSVGDAATRRGLGFEPYVPGAQDTLEIEVRAPPWIPVTEVRLITSAGERVLAAGDDLVTPPDPFGVAGVVRWTASIPMTEVAGPGTDDWFVVEAGMPYFLTGDLEDRGVPDTSDNNGDGVVDEDDIEDEDDDSGPFNNPPDPTDPSDPRFVFTKVVPNAWPIGFTNPILIDWAGDGWQPPGIGQ
jgi:hypothetical protein